MPSGATRFFAQGAAAAASQLPCAHHGADAAGLRRAADLKLHGAGGRQVVVEAGADGGHGGVGVGAREC